MISCLFWIVKRSGFGSAIQEGCHNLRKSSPQKTSRNFLPEIIEQLYTHFFIWNLLELNVLLFFAITFAMTTYINLRSMFVLLHAVSSRFVALWNFTISGHYENNYSSHKHDYLKMAPSCDHRSSLDVSNLLAY